MFDLDDDQEINLTDQAKDKIKTKQTTSGIRQYNVAASMAICKDVVFVVPEKIEDVLKELDIQFRSVEYSIFCQSDRTETSEKGDTLYIYLKDNYYIPEQSVSAASVDYEEDHKDYDTVILKHPDGCMNFSGTDREFINSNFDYSLLFVNKSFQTGNIRIPINPEKTVYITMAAKVKVERIIKRVEIPKEQLDKIKQRIIIHGYNGPLGGGTIPKSTYMECYGSRYGRGFGGYGGNVVPEFGRKIHLSDEENDSLLALLDEDGEDDIDDKRGIPSYYPKHGRRRR